MFEYIVHVEMRAVANVLYIYTSTAPSILLPVVRGSSIQNAGKFRARVFVYMYNTELTIRRNTTALHCCDFVKALACALPVMFHCTLQADYSNMSPITGGGNIN